KGENVVVRDADGRGVLVDFGVGGYEGAPSLTPFVLPPGTPEYQAPEAWRYLQAQQGRPAARYVPGPGDDLWALGVTLYRLLTDALPFQPQTELDLGEEILTHEPLAPHALNPRVPEALSRVCQRLLEKQPEARYADAAVLAAVLEEALAGADAAWDVPLCEGYGPSTATTEGREEVVRRGDEVGWDAWVHEAALPPRRGRKPAVRDAGAAPLLEDAGARPVDTPTPTPTPPESLAAPAPALAATPPTEAGATPDIPRTVADAFTSRRAGGPNSRGGGKWGVALLAMVAAAWNVLLLAPGHEAPRVPRADQEVALQCLPPDAGPAALPPLAEAIPAAVAPRVAPSKDGALMKKTLPPASSVTVPVKQALGVAGLCLTLACASSSPQVRPPPEPEDCPARSLKAMEALDIKLGKQLPARFVGGGYAGTYLDVRQGNWKVELGGGASAKFTSTTVLSCYLTLSDRVYGRCPSARTRDGTTHPVCFELLNTNGDLGTPREDDSTGDTARVHSTLRVRPVSRYE
ncbi:MAG TPA: serine/threonine protein kinase, partial [Myxococcus sp.]|nr:serine/threonine protein kinase [Myxococcus sp.]